MSTTSRSALGVLFLALATPLLAQTQGQAAAGAASGPVITATASADRIRFTASTGIVEMRVELFVSGGPSLYDSGWMKGNVLD